MQLFVSSDNAEFDLFCLAMLLSPGSFPGNSVNSSVLLKQQLPNEPLDVFINVFILMLCDIIKYLCIVIGVCACMCVCLTLCV